MVRKLKNAEKTGLIVGFCMNVLAIIIIAVLMGGLK